MSQEEKTPHRRRRPQVAQQTQEPTPPEPHRIVVTNNDDQPDWMVSANHISGAASRRAKKAEPAPKRTQERAENQAQAGYTAKKTADKPRGQDKPKTQAKKAPAKQANARVSSGASGYKPKKKKSRAALARQARHTLVGVLSAAVLVALAAVAVLGGGYVLDVKKTLDQGDGVFYPNIFVNDIPLEGKTLDQAAQDVTAQVMSLMSSWKITLRTQDGRSWDITGSDLNMQYDIADQLDQLWAIGHTGSSSARYEQVKALEETPVMRYTTLRYDMTLVNQILTQIKAEVDQSPINATRVSDTTKWPPFSYTDDVPGQELDITGMSEQICGMVERLESGVVELTPTTVEAAVTREYLEGQIVQLAMYETSIGKTGNYVENRHENIRIGTEKFNHLVIEPGESVSFNKVTGLRSAANGYQVALELAYGEYVEGTGGGICQVSSTLYNAVMNAGLTVTKRTAHSHPSSYVPKGQDATVQDNRLDLVFRNDTNAAIYIETNYYKKKNYYYTQFIIYGRPDPNGYTYELESQVVQTLAIPEVKIVQDKDAKYVVYDDETYVSSEGAEGYVVDVYKVTKDSRGLEVSREKIHTDTYKAVQPVTYVGVTPRETPVPDGYGGSID